jgi:hypothetical protein
MDVLLGLIVGGVVLVAIGYPIWKPAPQVLGSSRGPASELAALEERKESTYAAIRELGFDFHTDKLSEADYHLEIERLKAEAVGIVRQIEERTTEPPSGSDAVEREIAAIRESIERSSPMMAPAAAPAPMAAGAPQVQGTAVFCTQCGRPAAVEDRFCAGCGTQLRGSQ